MPENLSSILESTEPTLLTTGWGRTEGPLWHAEGYVTFVDLAGSRLLRWDPNGSVTVVRENTGEGNGCTLDRQGRLIMRRRRSPADYPDGGRRHGHDHCRALARQTVQ
jgi:sugar lactone lactonase YvrE